MFIKKFKLISKFSEENEFETTKTRTTTTTLSTKTITDDEGNLISPSGVFAPSSQTCIFEKVIAVSLPSRTPAHVETIEIIDDGIPSYQETNKEPEKKSDGPKRMEGPKKQKLITLDQLQRDRGIAKPVVISSDPETTMWV